jgi:hypothetical protein
MIAVDGEMRPVIDSSGRPIASTPEGIIAFWRFFGDSAVTDADHRPLVVYHGSFNDFPAFDSAKSEDGAFHFGSSEAASERLRGKRGTLRGAVPDGQNLMPVFLHVADPKRLKSDPMDPKSWRRVITRAKAEGYDGIVYPNEQEGGESWVVFESEQIKSAIGNPGVYDRNNPHLTDGYEPVVGAGIDVAADLDGQPAPARRRKGARP